MTRLTRAIIVSSLISLFVLSILVVAPGAAAPARAQGSNVVVVNVHAANIRSGPAANRTILGVVGSGTQLPVTGRDQQAIWWRVESPFGVGWIRDYTVVFRGTFAAVPVVDQPAGQLEVPTVIVDRFPAPVYRTPDRQAEIIGQAPSLGILVVTGRTSDWGWWQVQTNLGTGYIPIGAVAFRGDINLVPRIDSPTPAGAGTLTVENTVLAPPPAPKPNIAVVSAGRLNIRSGPGVEYASVTSVPWRTELVVTGRHPTLPWLRVEGPYGVGWVRIMWITFRGDWSAVPSVTGPIGGLEVPVAVVSLNRTVYTAPGVGPLAQQLAPGSYAVLGRTEDWAWLQIQTPLGTVWISSAEAAFRGVADNVAIVR